MKYMNVVKFSVKPAHTSAFREALDSQPTWAGHIQGQTIQTGENTFCGCGLWESKDAMYAAMDSMVAWLDTVRHMLEEISPELGVTDAVSGPVIAETGAS